MCEGVRKVMCASICVCACVTFVRVCARVCACTPTQFITWFIWGILLFSGCNCFGRFCLRTFDSS